MDKNGSVRGFGGGMQREDERKKGEVYGRWRSRDWVGGRCREIEVSRWGREEGSEWGR